jgi:hypothetical protein
MVHFSVDDTLIEMWASMKSFQRKDGEDTPQVILPGATGSSFVIAGERFMSSGWLRPLRIFSFS